MNTWKYAPSVENTRVEKLLTTHTFEEIVHKILSEMEVLCCHYDICKLNTDFARIIYCIQVSPDTFDLFFNSPSGYRGTYFQGPYAGLSANETLIQALLPVLCSQSLICATEVEKKFIRESLSSLSAKVWLAENGKHLCESCMGEWGNRQDDIPEILNGLWEKDDSTKAKNGRKAPHLTKIRIFGAFLDTHNNELVPWDKRHRAKELHDWGWS